MEYELIKTHNGYKIRKPYLEKFYQYVSKVYKGKYEWTIDYTYSKHFSLKVAQKHIDILKTSN